MSLIPGLGIVKGMALTLRRFFEPKATVRYPEVRADVAPRFRGRLQLLYDEFGILKCETCFQCAQACPIECIDMGGVDTKGRYHVHWGPPETYGERREESALRRSGRTVPDRAYSPFDPVDVSPVDEILEAHDYDHKAMLTILEEIQAVYGYLPVAALKHVSRVTGAWYAMLYGTASYYRHLRFEPPAAGADPGSTDAGNGEAAADETAAGAAAAGTSAGSAGEGQRQAEAAFRASLGDALGYDRARAH
jgi:ferredoxin